jgi:hypothetical protein
VYIYNRSIIKECHMEENRKAAEAVTNAHFKNKAGNILSGIL